VTIFTIGHSTRRFDEFIVLLKAHGITRLADIRTVPRSRRHPHFGGDALAASLPDAGIAYRHLAALGGLRQPHRDSRNIGWRHAGFRGYADYMETAEFARAVDELIVWAREGGERGAVMMCAEAVWWRCHRQLVADALVARGIAVRHITSATTATTHTLTEFARVNGERVTYPGLEGMA
jgi:uncharacterized protein (DUF488 family)